MRPCRRRSGLAYTFVVATTRYPRGVDRLVRPDVPSFLTPPMTAMPFFRHFTSVAAATLVAALLFASGPAAAQWIWKDEAGHVVASDQPPPPNTPASRIIKQPRARAAAPATPTVPSVDPSKADTPKSLADRDLAAKQQEKADAEAAKKAADDAARAQAMQDNCRAVRSNLAALQAGGRAARFNEKGEKVYIDDSQRQDEINKQQAQVSQYCQ